MLPRDIIKDSFQQYIQYHSNERYLSKARPMKLHKLLCPALLLILMACTPESEPEPLCFETKKEIFMEQNQNCENSSIKKYSFQNQSVYVFSQGICVSDNAAQVLTFDCEDICTLGGIAGFTECNGEEFFKNATVLETIWEAG